MSINLNEMVVSSIVNSMNSGKQHIVRSIEGLQIRTDYISSNIFYLGISDRVSLTSEPKWNILRVTIINNDMLVLSGSGRVYEMIWDNRTTYFDAVVVSNLYSTNFDGINDYAVGTGGLSLDTATAQTYSVWFKPQNLSARRCIWANATNDANVYGLMLYHQASSGIRIQARTASTLRLHDFTDLAPISGAWNHLVLSYSGNNNMNGFSAYLNGTKSVVTPASSSLSGTWLFSQDFTVGSRNTTFNFSGKIDEMTILDKKLSDSEVSDLYAQGPFGDRESLLYFGNFVHGWRMGDGDTVPTINDIYGSLNLTMVNGPTFIQDVG